MVYNSFVYYIYILWGGPFERRCLGAADWAPDNWAPCRLGAGYLGTVPRNEKNNEAGNSMNAVGRQPVSTIVLNPNASEASYKPKQRSYRKTNLKKNAGAR